MQWKQRKGLYSVRCPLPPSDIMSMRVFCKRTTPLSTDKKQTNGIHSLYKSFYLISTTDKLHLQTKVKTFLCFHQVLLPLFLLLTYCYLLCGSFRKKFGDHWYN